jgi:putative spermidine/putrescine transport system ATP-binding protein
MKLNSTAGATLKLRNLVKCYGKTTVVDGVSLDVAPGEFVTLLGPSGSGKTTTLNMIAGFCSVTAGDISMDGNPIARLKPHKRHIGVVFQHYALFPHMTVTDNIAFPLKQRRMPREQVRADVADALDLVKLRGFADRYPGQLSGGQQQRVALARALVFRPRLLLMDEPLGALDKNLREALQLEIKRIHREVGISFVYVTHDQEEALGLSDRIAIFNHGRVEQVGSAADLYERPESLFVADFIGESNKLRGHVVHHNGRAEVQWDGTRLPVAGRCSVDAGTPAVVVLRPEALTLTNARSSTNGAFILDGVISELLYLGNSRRVEVTLPSGHVMVVREQAGHWKTLAIGESVGVSYDPESAVVIPVQDDDDMVGPTENVVDAADVSDVPTSPTTASPPSTNRRRTIALRRPPL